MTRTYKLTDGTLEVNLIDATEPGIIAAAGGLGPTDIRPRLTFSGDQLQAFELLPVVERLRLNIRATSQDSGASMLQDLFKLLRRAREYNSLESAPWQRTPVYLQAQATGETNARYALVLGAASMQLPDLFQVPFEAEYDLEDTEWQVVREAMWRGAVPESFPTPTNLVHADEPTAEASLQVGNYRHTNELTHIYNYDDSLTAFSSNLVAAGSYALWEVSASTPAVDDAVYLGSTTGPWFNARFRLSTIGNFNATFVVEYWDGSAWSAGGGVGQLNSFTAYPVPVNFTNPDNDWASTTVNGVAGYWIRLRLTVVTTWTTSPVQDANPVVCINENYVEIASDAIAGDEAALTHLIWYNPSGAGAPLVPSTVIVGMKSRGLTTFISMINAGGQNPTGWSEAYGTDTSEVADTGAPGGSHALCTFATNQAMVARATMTYSSTSEVNFAGAYRVFLRCRQVGSSNGQVVVRLRLTHSATVDGQDVPLQDVGEGIEVVDLGRFEILPNAPRGPEAASLLNFSLNFVVMAQSLDSTTPDLEIFDLVLIPVDEWSMVTTEFNGQTLTIGRGVAIDGGVLRRNTNLVQVSPATDVVRPMSNYETRGALPAIPPARQARLYFLVLSQNSAGVPEAAFGLTGTVVLRTVPRWHLLRGAA